MSPKITAKRKPRVEERSSGEVATDPAYQSMKTIPIELQQLLLHIFTNAFSSFFDPKLPVLIQEVKQHLYNRDFNAAFGQNDFLAAYVVRWSPSRALAYTHIFANLSPLRTRLLSKSCNLPEDDNGEAINESLDPEATAMSVVCIGAGAGAELVALGGFLKHLVDTPADREERSKNTLWRKPLQIPLKITAVDIADWKEITQKLHSGLTTAPPLSQYASSEAKAANTPLIDSENINFNFIQQDILTTPTEEIGSIFTNATLITLMFTLNELYATSISATTNLLLSLTMLLDPGALLLVVDSPGSYSTVKIGKSSRPSESSGERKYPMQWLLDHTLLEASAVGSSKVASGQRQWEKVDGREAEWFRLDGELRYPIELEDMRYQLHLYRRV